MKNIQCILLAFVLMLAVSSCDQYLDVELPGQEPKLVVNGILENRDTIKVSLTQSRSVLEGDEYDSFDQIKNGNVFIKTGAGETFPLVFIEDDNPYDPSSYYFLIGHDFAPNERYEIFAESQDLEPVSGQVIFPSDVPIKEISYISLGSSESNENYDLVEFTVKFEDSTAQNFYQLDGTIYGTSTLYENSFYSSQLYPQPVNPAYEKDYGWGSGFGILFSDVLLRGENAEMVFRTTLPRDYDLEVTINLSNVSESYFRYYDSANLQTYNEGDILSQPVLVYNNIQNGLGVFAAKNAAQEVISITLED